MGELSRVGAAVDVCVLGEEDLWEQAGGAEGGEGEAMKERLIGVQCDFGAVFLLYIYISINRILFVCCIVVVIEMMMIIIIII